MPTQITDQCNPYQKHRPNQFHQHYELSMRSMSSDIPYIRFHCRYMWRICLCWIWRNLVVLGFGGEICSLRVILWCLHLTMGAVYNTWCSLSDTHSDRRESAYTNKTYCLNIKYWLQAPFWDDSGQHRNRYPTSIRCMPSILCIKPFMTFAL